MAKKRTRKPKVFVEVLQNGEILASSSFRWGIPRRVSMGAGFWHRLHLPFYPLTRSMEVIAITRRGVRLLADQSWDGFASRKGTIHHWKERSPDADPLVLERGDYASLHRNDLRVLVKIAEAPAAENTPLSKEYRGGGFWRLFWGQREERRTLALGVLCAAIVFAGIVGGLLRRHPESPRTLKDLDTSYSLAFIHPKHLETLPEALHGSLDRRRPVEQAFDFYAGFYSLLIGNDGNFSFLYPQSVSTYKIARLAQKSELAQRTRLQTRLDAMAQEDKASGILVIPAVKGESLAGQVLRVLDKTAILHDNYQETLTRRRKTTTAFQADPGYDFSEYKHLVPKGKGAEEIAKIRVFSQLTDEEAMYKEASDLAVRANREQRRIREQRQAFTPLTQESSDPIGMPGGTRFASFLTPEDTSLLNVKLDGLRVSRFGEKKPEVKEPLVGELDPKLIERIISKNRFQLQLCFELALRRNEAVNGTMKWQWRLDSRGRISDLTLLSTSIHDPQMKNCIRKKIAGWKFPRPRRGSVEITYPFHFKPARS